MEKLAKGRVTGKVTEKIVWGRMMGNFCHGKKMAGSGVGNVSSWEIPAEYQ